MEARGCPYRTHRVVHDERGDFHLCHYEQGDCECLPVGRPYLIIED